MKKVDRNAGLYFAFQGLAICAWWFGLYYSTLFRALFELDWTGNVLSSFWLPDLLFLALGSFVAAWLCFTSHPYKGVAAWFVTGLITYATTYAFAFSLASDVGWLGVVLMAPATLFSGVFAVGVSILADRMFRPTRDGSGKWMAVKTFSQIVIVWSLILGLFPYLIVGVENKLGIPHLRFPFQTAVSAILFVLASIPGVWSAWVMSMEGKGTPLPLDHASKLVISGPYKYIRNPMAFSGIGQGLIVALFWGSALVGIYALIGSLVWQWVFRPLEEENLEERFGQPYIDYKRTVRCWIPSIRSPIEPQSARRTRRG
ncbi:MAG: isoprenylcysteine carboxylmethyltransferase family protein [Acidobacteria bacterium]|nr:MAG: isoprenylcysteine carboxylmethyltransferase family protein [Acidobacteriota bacterium]REK02732.1 MAG: isoprenylcysteine carboxylmethyltransferase family protein [Acidobacteriota bacterium]REK13463.1 MAG: isoprenylcysteine carboxylmethyltransferase family protein [Acidobacteriota bacterium]REK41457.1 MAG: isoprenylcysteine carboxylmethyltransferase family protein [Acidobacteriota bacterium]